MADVSIDAPDGDRLREADRGQLLVVTGLVMAVSLVALVVLLNATIYSENVATRGIEADDGEAAAFRASAVEGVGELVDATNRAGPPPNATVNDTVLTGVEDLDRRIARSYAERGGVTRIETDASGLTRGTYLDTDGNATSLANATNATAYGFSGEIERTRGFVLDLDADALATTTAGNATSEAFHVAFDGSALSESSEVYVYRNGGGEVVVANGTGGTAPTPRCSVAVDPGDRVSLDLTAERLEETACVGVWPTELIAPTDSYAVDFGNADAADGTAIATVRPAGTGAAPDHADVSPAVYDATVELRYRTTELRFGTTVRVAPGEPRA
ncbi:hypothetical protein SAMN04488066_10899 [Halorubrum aquaticum]|uniref:Uncharacterized protein n=1 Tax=Halorubrum aquaticum TaxID=387340 RepID=A0A1I3B131_9EURY|nr:hypothetical protein [Halorubrum aquaticum]SFH55659.1 hypothetical protein SAMN04488066_10899 [Halorubrum aquaticum]